MHPSLKTFLQGKIELSEEQQEFVSNCFKPVITGRGQLLLTENSIARDIYFVVKGYLRVFVNDKAGNEATRFLIFEGQMGTAFPSFILQRPSVASVQSPEPAELLTLSHHNRELLHKQVPGWGRMDRIAIEKEYIAAITELKVLLRWIQQNGMRC